MQEISAAEREMFMVRRCKTEDFELRPLDKNRLSQFKKDMQEAFQKGAEDGFGKMEEQILPESHIDRSLNEDGAAAYEAFLDGQSVGGAIVKIDSVTNHNYLDFLYVKNGVHSKGVGLQIWKGIEDLYPQTKVWESCTPYFEKRNIHFYVNKCGFHIVEFFNSYHPDPHDLEEDLPDENEYFEGMFRFEKVMKP